MAFWDENLGESGESRVLDLSFSKAFDAVTHSIPLHKLLRYTLSTSKCKVCVGSSRTWLLCSSRLL